MISAVLRRLTVVGGLLILLTYFWYQSRSLDPTLLERVYQPLKAFELHDAELNRDVLLARAGLLNHYDTLAQSSQDLADELNTLQQLSTTVPVEARQLLDQSLGALSTALREKEAQLEYFKSDNALLHNSLVYVIHTSHHLRGRAAEAGHAALMAELGTLTNAMLDFVETPEDTAGEEIKAALARLPTTPKFRQDLQGLAAHGRYIVAALPQMDALIRELISAPTTSEARVLQDALLRYHHQLEARTGLFRLLLYVAAVALLGYLIYLFACLQANARTLRLSNEALQQEIDERRRTEEALRESEERYMLAMQGANEGLWDWLVGPDIIHVSEHVCWLLGLEPALPTITAEAWHSCIHPDDRKRFRETLRSHLRGDTEFFQCEIRVMKPGREVGWAYVHGLGLRDKSGRIYRMAGSIGDMTARKRLEHQTRQQELQLIQANKMTALGTLISGMAHEVNNPNQLVLTNVRLLQDAWAGAVQILDQHKQAHGEFRLASLPYAEIREAIPTLMQDIHEGALRIERITHDLRDFARPSLRGSQAAFDISDPVQLGLGLLAHLIRKKTRRFRVDLAPELPPVLGDPQHMEQVVVNLVTNALEALPDPSRGVTVSTRFDPAAHGVVLTVEDEGTGIPPEHLARLCDPFFTTKQASGGTGLGLAISSSLVRAHGGRLSFASKPSRGTRAIVTLPASVESPDLPQAVTPC